MAIKVGDIYGSGEYLKYEDLKGRTFTLRVASVRTHTFEPDGDKPGRTVIILGFLGAKKELQLNGRSARRLAESFGDDAESWVGKDVMLMPSPGSQPSFNTVDAFQAPAGATPSTGPDPEPPPPAPESDPIDDSSVPF